MGQTVTSKSNTSAQDRKGMGAPNQDLDRSSFSHWPHKRWLGLAWVSTVKARRMEQNRHASGIYKGCNYNGLSSSRPQCLKYWTEWALHPLCYRKNVSALTSPSVFIYNNRCHTNTASIHPLLFFYSLAKSLSHAVTWLDAFDVPYKALQYLLKHTDTLIHPKLTLLYPLRQRTIWFLLHKILSVSAFNMAVFYYKDSEVELFKWCKKKKS